MWKLIGDRKNIYIYIYLEGNVTILVRGIMLGLLFCVWDILESKTSPTEKVPTYPPIMFLAIQSREFPFHSCLFNPNSIT